MVKIAIIGGSGLDDPQILEDYKELRVYTRFGKPSDILTVGKIQGVDVVILARHGKKHNIYPSNINFRANIQALKDQGCTHIIATTAVGSLREDIKPDDLVFLDQFIDFTKQRRLTLFKDGDMHHAAMAEPFCKQLRNLLEESAKSFGFNYHKKGTVLTIEGPRFSTKAESFMFRNFGADVINMSTVPEVTLAREAKICYQAIAMSTDYDCWKEDEEPVSWEMICKRMEENADKVKKLLLDVVPKIKDWKCDCKK